MKPLSSSTAEWPAADPEEAGLDPQRLAELIEFARSHESERRWSEDYAAVKSEILRAELGPLADVDVVGPFTEPGALNGLVLREGRLVAEFGDTSYVDEIASATKSFLSTLTGIALRDGLIEDVQASVFSTTGLQLLGSQHNRKITWHHLLQQTSEWDGELFGKEPSGHAGRRVGEPLQEPGTYFEYNDVRVNLLSRCLLELFREPLPDVLQREVMGPIGASDSWQWHGYRDSDVVIGGRKITSVSGGAHWGGGIWMNSRDLALYGQLYLNGGSWNDREILPESWIRQTTTSCPCNYMYGYLWWLQHGGDGRQVCYAAQGGGSHHCFVIPGYEMVVVVRWLRDGAWMRFLEIALDTVTDRACLVPPHYDFGRVNAPQGGG